MIRNIGRGIEGIGLLLLTACGGTVDLNTGDGGSGGSSAGSANPPQAGGTTAATGGAGATNGGTGEPSDPELPRTEGMLAYDADREAFGRAIFLTSFGSGCTQRLSDPSVQAKQPAFSADSRRLSYAAQAAGLYQIHVRDLESGDVEQVTDLPVGATSPAFSPDGSQLAFVTGDPEGAGNRADGAGSLMLVDLETLETTLVADGAALGCCTPQYLSPIFNGPDEILVGTGTSLVGIELPGGAVRDLVPITGRIPNPQDPSLAPDGERYVFSDYCGFGLTLYLARTDGSSGDTCAGAVPVDTGHSMISADWGPFGSIAAELNEPGRGVLFIDDTDFSVAAYQLPGARNPAWAPVARDDVVFCE